MTRAVRYEKRYGNARYRVALDAEGLGVPCVPPQKIFEFSLDMACSCAFWLTSDMFNMLVMLIMQ